jgi:hypothetical protein
LIAFGCGRHGPRNGEAHQLAPPEEEIIDIAGTTHRPFGDPQVRAVALIFLLPDCPIANSYVPELNRLYSDYTPRGVRLFLIQVDPQSSAEELREHARQYQLQPPVVWDMRHVWVRRIGATVTPQAAVLSPAGTLLYLGRIDNRYVGLGKRREQVTAHDLRDALDAVLAGEPVPQARTEAIGCAIPDLSPGE